MRTTITAAISAAFAFCVGLACQAVGQAEPEASQAAAPKGPSPMAAPARYDLAAAGGSVFDRLPDVSERAVLSVVNIRSTKAAPQSEGPEGVDPFFRRFFRGMPAPERNQRSLGSGVIVDAKGVILTNNHVVEDADDIAVTLSDEREYAAEIVGTDPASDLAVIKLIEPPSDLEALPFGDSSSLRLGEAVLAIGNPFGVGQTVTLGIVSAKGRTNVRIVDYADFIQTDAAINPGNSGGALVNMKGELVGINTAILSRSGGYQGIGFAIPSNMVSTLMDDLLDDGRVSRGFLGVFIQDLSPALAEAMGVEPNTKGVVVSDVMEGGPADDAGIRAGDVILTVDGKVVDSAARLRLVIASKGSDKGVKIALLRDGRSKTVRAQLKEKDAPAPVAQKDESPSKLGIRLEDLDARARQQLRVDPDELASGAVVVGLAPGGPAAEAGLRVGDVIVEVNRRPVDSAAEAIQALQSEGDTLLRVYRRGGYIFVVIDR
ncbi:MAG: Do family serine endopeptidase [Myxococcota bacterium]